MQADLGGCVAYLEKEIRIYESRDSLDFELPESFSDPITGFEVFPNPNVGQFYLRLTLTEAMPAELWLFTEQAALVQHWDVNGAAYYELPYQQGSLPAGVYTAIARVGGSWRYLGVVRN